MNEVVYTNVYVYFIKWSISLSPSLSPYTLTIYIIIYKYRCL